MEDKNLAKSIEETDEYFCRAVDLIPPDHFGFDEEIKSKLKADKHEMTDRKLTNVERKRFKEHGRQLLSRLDTDSCRTVTQIWSWLATQQPTSVHPSKSNVVGTANQLTQRTQLVAKLQTKLDEMRQNRKAHLKLKKKRLAANNNTNTNTKKRKTDTNSNNKTSITTDRQKKEDIKIENDDSNASIVKTKNKKDEIKTPPITNSNGGVVYSKFDFSVFGVKSRDDKSGKKTMKNKNLSGKDYKTLLKTVEKRDEQLNDLKRENPEKATETEKRQHWDAALDRARGFKVKDDKNLLKQNVKRKENRKKQSEKQWQKRQEFVDNKKQKRQDDRRKNIQEKKNKNKAKKMDKARKKGRLI